MTVKEIMNNFDLVGEVECVWKIQAICGEGPLWIDKESYAEQSIYFLDIDGQMLHSYKESTCEKHSWKLEEKTGWVLPRRNNEGFVMGCSSGVYFLDLSSGKRTFALLPDPQESENRFNDAKCDSEGRIWAGRSHDPETKTTGCLFRIDPDLSYSSWDGPYICPNGPAISSDDCTLYHVDTFGRTVWVFDKHPDGSINNRREFIRLNSETDGFPDGITVDIENRVWLAHWGGARVSCFSPQAELLGTVKLPVPQITSCAFGGRDLSTLYITTAARNLNLDENPLAGGLFKVETKTKGFVSPAFAG